MCEKGLYFSFDDIVSQLYNKPVFFFVRLSADYLSWIDRLIDTFTILLDFACV